MARPGHKANCKCVGCSPATRKRGQAALKAARKNPDAPARKPKKAPTRAQPAAPKPRRNPGPAVVVVQTPAPAPAAPKRRKPAARKNPALAAPARRNPEAAAPRRAHPHLPAELTAGRYVVLATERGDGGRLRPVKVFTRVSEAMAYAKGLPDGSKACVAAVHATLG